MLLLAVLNILVEAKPGILTFHLDVYFSLITLSDRIICLTNVCSSLVPPDVRDGESVVSADDLPGDVAIPHDIRDRVAHS